MERTPVSGGLKLPTSTGLSVQDAATSKEAWNTIDEVENELFDMGLTTQSPPPYDRPSITPEQLSTAINKDYTLLYAQHLAWFTYVSPILARIKARLLGVKNEKRDIEVTLRKAIRSKNRNLPKEEKLSEKDIDDETWSDSRYKELTQEEQRLEQKKLELDAYLETMKDNLAVISRQVEIRKLEMSGPKRENNMPSSGWRNPRT